MRCKVSQRSTNKVREEEEEEGRLGQGGVVSRANICPINQASRCPWQKGGQVARTAPASVISKHTSPSFLPSSIVSHHPSPFLSPFPSPFLSPFLSPIPVQLSPREINAGSWRDTRPFAIVGIKGLITEQEGNCNYKG